MTISSKNDGGVAAGKIDKMVLQKSAGKLIALMGYNAGGAQFIHLHDAVAQPADATVPLHSFAIAAADNFFVLIPMCGIDFSFGLCACVSTTANATTLGAKDVTMLAVLVA